MAKSSPTIRFLPSQIEFFQVSQQYPITWQRRFLSSVPIRDYALHNVSAVLGSHELILVHGASSSGKSTFLRAIYKPELLTSGTVSIRQSDDDSATALAAKPIFLHQLPSVEEKSSRKNIQEILLFENRANKYSSSGLSEEQQIALLGELGAVLGLCTNTNGSSWTMRQASDLSSSETYLLLLLQACMHSYCSGTIEMNLVDGDDDCCLQLPAPILLIDEWLDTETSTVIHAVQESLTRLVSMTGAIVCIVTHKKERFKSNWVNRTVNMCRGEILSMKR
jgi:ABC-type polysaccharide/polyol phosphate transport system ATPase subunit